MDKKISVIIPVYNVEKYLACCIDSILAQTFPYFELILVNDGSSDNCGSICDTYAKKDNRIIVIHQKNTGVSAARNAGIDWAMENSTSQWITFVDSDDAVLPEYLEILYNHAAAHSADIASTNAHIFETDSELKEKKSSIMSSRVFSGKEGSLGFYRGDGKVTQYIWGKLIKKELLKEIRFPMGITYGEDEEVVVKVTYSADVVVSLYAKLYCYRQRCTSAAQRKFNVWAYEHVKIIDSCITYFEDKSETELAVLARRKKQKVMAKNTLLAYGTKIKYQVPKEYTMPLWEALYITVKDTVQRGGVKHIFARIRQFINKVYRTGKR